MHIDYYFIVLCARVLLKNTSFFSVLKFIPELIVSNFEALFFWQENIGWRDHSRKLVVVTTDGDFHIGGDGLVCNFY
jgi:hypothetical protein